MWVWRWRLFWRDSTFPGLPLSNVRTQLANAQAEMKPLEADVANLRVYKQRRAELQSEMDALQKQLATLQTIVPEEKQTDQFILMVQSAAVSSGVSIRQLTAKPIANKPYYFEMPFDIEADGPYLFGAGFLLAAGTALPDHQRGRSEADAVAKGASGKFHMTPGTSVTGTFTITTFFTQAAPAGDSGRLRRQNARAMTMKLAKHSANILAVLAVSHCASSRGFWAQSNPAPKHAPKTKRQPAPSAAAPAADGGCKLRGTQVAPVREAAKRDPFSPLINEKKEGSGAAAFASGQSRLVIATVRVDGTVRSRDGMIAVLSNPEAARLFRSRGRSLVRRRCGKDWFGWSHVSRKLERRFREAGRASGDEANLRECRRAAMRIMWRAWGLGAFCRAWPDVVEWNAVGGR